MQTYKAVALNCMHLLPTDAAILETLAHQQHIRVMARPTGYFIKLSPDPQYNEYFFKENRRYFSRELRNIIDWAIKKGFCLIEFDCDAEALDEFPVFEW